MEYEYGSFSSEQMSEHAKLMHDEIHKLLLYKDQKISDAIFENDAAYDSYFENLLLRYGGFNTLLGEPKEMVAFMSTLKKAQELSRKIPFDATTFSKFRHLILDAHGYLTAMFGEVRHDKHSIL